MRRVTRYKTGRHRPTTLMKRLDAKEDSTINCDSSVEISAIYCVVCPDQGECCDLPTCGSVFIQKNHVILSWITGLNYQS